MTRLIAILLLLLFAIPVCAQDPKNGDAKDEEVVDLGVPADFNDYLKKRFPDLDPGGEHDLFNLKDYKDKDKRHNYTVAMTQLVISYMSELRLGSTIAKLFDQYARGKEGNQVTFKVLYAVVLMYYPPGQPNTVEAEKMLREVTESAPNFAYPWFLLANFEYARFTQIEGSSPRPVLQALDKALAIRPDFLRAVLLKSRVFMHAKPPRSADMRDLLEPFVNDRLPKSPDDLEDTLGLYAACHKLDEALALITSLIDSEKLSGVQKVRALQVRATLHIQDEQMDKAIDDLTKMVEWSKPAENPQGALFAHRGLADCWKTKALLIKVEDKKLEDPKNKKDYESFIDAAESEHKASAEVERLYMPMALRGNEARDYIDFIYTVKDDPEAARDWLKGYLDGTDLTTPQRNVLENVLKLLEIELNPTEEGLIELYEKYLSQDDMEKLGASLATAKENIRLKGGPHFHKETSLKFFVGQLDNRVRVIVGIVAFLVADTAQSYLRDCVVAEKEARENAETARKDAEAAAEAGGDEAKVAEELSKKAAEKAKKAKAELDQARRAVIDAAAAIADRLEKETELNSDAQAELQKSLSEALILIGDRAAQERGARHEAGLIKAAKGKSGIHGLMKGIATVWSDDKFTDRLKNKPPKISRLDLFSPDKTVAWLEKLADCLKLDAEEAEKAAKGGDEE